MVPGLPESFNVSAAVQTASVKGVEPDGCNPESSPMIRSPLPAIGGSFNDTPLQPCPRSPPYVTSPVGRLLVSSGRTSAAAARAISILGRPPFAIDIEPDASNTSMASSWQAITGATARIVAITIAVTCVEIVFKAAMSGFSIRVDRR